MLTTPCFSLRLFLLHHIRLLAHVSCFSTAVPHGRPHASFAIKPDGSGIAELDTLSPSFGAHMMSARAETLRACPFHGSPAGEELGHFKCLKQRNWTYATLTRRKVAEEVGASWASPFMLTKFTSGLSITSQLCGDRPIRTPPTSLFGLLPNF